MLSKTVSHALRHDPSLYGLALGVDGWIDIDNLLDGLKRENASLYSGLTKHHLVKMISLFDKKRHEIYENKIRASYGHSIQQKLNKDSEFPPDELFHGTTSKLYVDIMKLGLKPMHRHYVHMSINKHDALEVAKRKDKQIVLLKVLSKNAHEQGVLFYKGNEKVWLTNHVPPMFLLKVIT